MQLTHMEGPLTGTPRWSPDGRYALYTTAERSTAKVILVENFRY